MRRKNKELDELTKTQVLNLKALEEAAKYERKTSAKPAIITACAGVMSILLGITYPFITGTLETKSLKEATPKTEEVATDTYNDISNKVQEETLVCAITSLNNADGTNTKITLNFIFNESKLQSYTKMFQADAQAQNINGLQVVQNYASYFKAFDGNLPGYTVATQQSQTTMNVVTTIDLQQLDKTTVPATHTLENMTNPEYELNLDKESIYNFYTMSGYNCK